MGTDLVKDPRVIRAAYDDAEGVTAEFNRNMLAVLNRELQADFRPEDFEHVALFDEEHELIEMRLRARREHTAFVGDLDLEVHFDAGYVPQEAADRAIHEPLVVVQRALEAEAPYFVDFVGQTLGEQYPGLTTTTTQAVTKAGSRISRGCNSADASRVAAPSATAFAPERVASRSR